MPFGQTDPRPYAVAEREFARDERWQQLRDSRAKKRQGKRMAAEDVLHDSASDAAQTLVEKARGIYVTEVLAPEPRPLTLKEARDLKANPQALATFVNEGVIRVYLREPDTTALLSLLDRTLGKAPSQGERLVLERLEQAERDRQFLAEVLQEYVDAAAFPDIRARLAELAGGSGEDQD